MPKERLPIAWRIRRGPPLAWLILKGEAIVRARSVLSVREHRKLVTCLRRAYSPEVASGTKTGSRFGRLRTKAGFSGEREGRERRWRLFFNSLPSDCCGTGICGLNLVRPSDVFCLFLIVVASY